MKKCPRCGGSCYDIGSGKYQCDCCGNSFSDDDFIPAPKKSAKPLKDSGTDVFDNNINGILEITWSDGKYTYSGSGLLITSDGYAITNTHVVTGQSGNTAPNVFVKVAGQTISTDVVKLGDDKGGSGSGVDLALLKLPNVPRSAVSLSFTDSERVRNGEKVYVIGNSLGYGTCITAGIVSDKLRDVNGKYLIMTDCAVNHGNSGGPMFNDTGKVMGVIVSGIDNAEGMNFAIPSRTVMEFIKSCSRYIIVDKDF